MRSSREITPSSSAMSARCRWSPARNLSCSSAAVSVVLPTRTPLPRCWRMPATNLSGETTNRYSRKRGCKFDQHQEKEETTMLNVNKDNIPDHVIAALSKDIPDRNRQIMTSLIRHMHDFCKE